MKTFQLSAIAIALATISGSINAIEVIQYNDWNLDETTGDYYQQASGTYDANTGITRSDVADYWDESNKLIHKGTKGPATIVSEWGKNYNQYSYQEIRKGLLVTQDKNKNFFNTQITDPTSQTSRWVNSTERSTISGQVERIANTRVELNNAKTEIAGTEQRVKDGEKFVFTADNLNTTIGAKVGNYKSNSIYTFYRPDQALNYTYDMSSQEISLENKVAYDKEGKANGILATGDHKDNYHSKSENYNIGKSELAYAYESSSDRSSTEAHYIYKQDKNGNYLDTVGNITTDPDKYVFELIRPKATSEYDISHIIDADDFYKNTSQSYQTNQNKIYENTSENSLKTKRTDVFDGFVSLNERTSNDYNVDYANAKNVLDFENKSSSTYKTKSRILNTVQDKTGNSLLALADGKPTTRAIIETNGNSQFEQAVFEASEYTDGKNKGSDKQFLKSSYGIDGYPYNTRWADTAVEHSVNNAERNETRIDSVDGFVTVNNSKQVDTAKYARNQQENIEVTRDLTYNDANQYKNIQRDYVYTAATDAKIKLKDVDRKIDGSLITVNDVREWTELDSNGKATKKYFVVLGHDLNGQEIRKEVAYTPQKLSSQKANIITDNQSENNSTEKVYAEGEKVFYDKNTSQSLKNITNVQGTDIGEHRITTYDNKTTLFTKANDNGLDHQQVINRTWDNQTAYERNASGNIILEKNKPVINEVSQRTGIATTTVNNYQAGQAKNREELSTYDYSNKTSDSTGKVLSTDKGHDNSSKIIYTEQAKDKKTGKLASTTDTDWAKETTISARQQTIGYDYAGTAKAYINNPIIFAGTGFFAPDLHQDGRVDVGLAVSAATEISVTADEKRSQSKVLNKKLYQDGGAVALQQKTTNNDNQIYTYNDGSTTVNKQYTSEEIALFNKGKAEKYREAVSLYSTENSWKAYQKDEDGDIILINGQPVERGTESQTQTVKTSENLYQIGQERKSDTLTLTDRTEKSNVDGSRIFVGEDTLETIKYRTGQKEGKESEILSASNSTETTIDKNTVKTDKQSSVSNKTIVYQQDQELKKLDILSGSTNEKQTKADNTGYSYSNSNKMIAQDYNTRAGLLGGTGILNTVKKEELETLAQTGKNTVSIVRSEESVIRADRSNAWTVSGTETITGNDITTLTKTETNLKDKFGTSESSTLSRTETKVAANQSATSNTLTRTDSVSGVVLTEAQTNTDVAGKSVISSRTTSLNARGLTTDQITLNGKDLQAELNHLSNNVDKVQKTAYRGIAIALAAQQAVPNIKPGQVAVFGGVGHYEGETAGSIGVVTSVNDRVSASGAFGFASGNEFGGRVGVAYVFGGD